MKSIEQEQFVKLEDVFATDEDESLDEDDRPLQIGGVSQQFWDEVSERVAAIRPSLVAGKIYFDGEICGADWWLPKHDLLKYMIASTLRQPEFLAAQNLVLVSTDVGCGTAFSIRDPH